MVDSNKLARSLFAVAGVAADKRANAITSMNEEPADNAALQAIVGDANPQPLSWMSQNRPSTGPLQVANPENPITDDVIFWDGMFEGATFMDNEGSYWNIESYSFEGAVVIRNIWLPRRVISTTVQKLRASIHSWTDPIHQRVPPPPIGADYGTLDVRVIG